MRFKTVHFTPSEGCEYSEIVETACIEEIAGLAAETVG